MPWDFRDGSPFAQFSHKLPLPTDRCSIVESVQFAFRLQIEPEDLGEILASGHCRIFGNVVFHIMFKAVSMLHLMQPTEGPLEFFPLDPLPAHSGESMPVFVAQDIHY